jgi:hypothetical protein
MAAKTTQSANDIVNYLVRGAAPSWAGATTLYLALHTGAVPLLGAQDTNEVAYTGYARVAFIRDPATGLFSAAAAGQSTNNALVQFGICTGGTLPVVASHASIGTAPTGAGVALLSGTLASALTININIRPEFDPSSIIYGEQ